jgi:hypothetical protein
MQNAVARQMLPTGLLREASVPPTRMHSGENAYSPSGNSDSTFAGFLPNGTAAASSVAMR